ncbi:MAG: hypothetical protein HKP20_02715 [Akkermansiaceae bacterium]|nr:hypothetical protein [Akkermansiaceae bacterium]
MSATIKQCVPDSIEPPYADFFNERILHHIHDELPSPAIKRTLSNLSIWQQFGKWLAIPAAAGAMAICFYIGMQVGEKPETTTPTIAEAMVPTVYTPDGDVHADMFKSESANAVVIVLEGLEDIPDDYDIVRSQRHGRSGNAGAVMVNTEMTF